METTFSSVFGFISFDQKQRPLRTGRGQQHRQRTEAANGVFRQFFFLQQLDTDGVFLGRAEYQSSESGPNHDRVSNSQTDFNLNLHSCSLFYPHFTRQMERARLV